MPVLVPLGVLMGVPRCDGARAVQRTRSVAEQVVQAGLGAGLRVHRLHDDGGVGAVVLTRLGLLGQVAADDHAATGHAAVDGFTGVAVEDGGALADVHAHAQHRVFFDHNAFDHFGSSANKAIITNDSLTSNSLLSLNELNKDFSIVLYIF